MKNTFLLLVVLITNVYFAYSQNIQDNKLFLSGVIKDSSELQAPVQYVSVSLFKDSTLLKSTMTDGSGYFEFKDIIVGKYQVYCSDIRYLTKEIYVNLERDTIMDIKLIPNLTTIDEVVITGRSLKMGSDRYSISLKNNSIIEGKNTTQVLAMLPGMSSAMGGGVLFRGQPLGKIYINGRRVTDQNELNALDASAVSNIDVQYNPSVNDDAQVRGAIINIKLNPLSDGGYSGSVEGSVTFRPKYGYSSSNLSSIFTYQYKKLNIYNYLNFDDFKSIYEYDVNNIYKNSNKQLNTNSKETGRIPSLSENLALEYRFNPKHSLGLSLSGYFTRNNPENESFTESQQNLIKETSRSSILGYSRTNRLQSTLRYQWNFSDKGSNLIVEADYLYNDAKSSADYNFEYYNSNGGNIRSNIMRDNSSNPNRMFEIKPQLEFVVGKNGKLNTGVRYYSNQTDRDLQYYNFKDDNWVINTTLSDKFKVSGQGAAAYAEFSSSINKFSYNVGLRYQYDNISHNSISQNIQVDKNYSNLFPTIGLGYAVDEKELYINLSFRRSIRYIPYNEISPTIYFQNEYSYTKGNPNLTIPIDNSLDFSISIKSFNLWYTYSHNKNGIEYFTYIDNENPMVKYSMPQNAGITNWHLIGADYTLFPLKCWKMSLSAMFTYKILNYQEDGIDKGYQTSVFEGGIDNNITFKTWGLFANFYGETKYIVDNKTMLPVFYISIGAYKYFFNKKLLLSIESQPFISKLRDYSIDNPDFYQYSKFKTNQTNFRLSLKYIFKKGKNIRSRTVEALQSVETRNERK